LRLPVLIPGPPPARGGGAIPLANVEQTGILPQTVSCVPNACLLLRLPELGTEEAFRGGS